MDYPMSLQPAFGRRVAPAAEPLLTIPLHPSEVLSLLNQMSAGAWERTAAGDRDGANRIAARIEAIKDAIR